MNAHTGTLASPTDPATWSSHEAATMRFPLVGYVFTATDPFFVIDLDSCIDPETGEIAPWALAIVHRFPTYWEISQSGRGLHGIGYGALLKAGNRKGKIEIYDQERYVALTGNVLPGYEAIRNCQRELIAWHDEVWPVQEPRKQSEPTPEPIIIGDADELSADEIIEKLSNHRDKGTKFRELFDGGLYGFPSPSEARYSLIGMVAGFWTTRPDIVEEILQRSGQWNDKCEKRPDLVRSEIQRQLDKYTGDHYSRSWGSRIVDGIDQETGEVINASSRATADEALIDAMSCNEVRLKLKAAEKHIVQLEAQVTAQAKIIRDKQETIKGVERILATDQTQAGPRITGAGLFMELQEQVQKGRKPKEHGYHIPAVWIARRTGQTAQTVNRHLQDLAKKELITRKIVNEKVGEEDIGADQETGEVLTVGEWRKRGYIAMQPKAIVTNFTEYKRLADAPKHGGKREALPYCEKHPNAGTVTHTIVECAEKGCGEQVDYRRTVQKPDEIFAPNMQDGSSEGLAATGTDGVDKMRSPIGTVSDIDKRKMHSPHSGYQAPIDLHQRPHSWGVE